MTRITNEAEYSVKPNIQSSGLSQLTSDRRLLPMAKSGPHRPGQKPQPRFKSRNFIKNWRVFRELTVEQLAEASGMSTGNISALENHRQGHSVEGLEKLANALKTTPDALLGVDPLSEGIGEFWPLWEKASPKDRELLTEMAERLVKK